MRHEEGIVGEILERLDHRTPAVFLDYDGTLTPIVRGPEAAAMSQETRRIVRDLARHVPVAVISGRDLKDVKRRVDLDHCLLCGQSRIRCTLNTFNDPHHSSRDKTASNASMSSQRKA
jgi:trehalose-phosphatase